MDYNVNSVLIKNNLSLSEFTNIVNESTYFDVVRNKIGFGNKNKIIYLYI